MASWRDQAAFSNQSGCVEFVPNRLRPIICCDCMKQMFAHSSDAVSDDTMIQRALEHSQAGERTPTKIGLGGKWSANFGTLFMGGFRAILNLPFLVEQNVHGVVNCAKGLEIFGPNYVKGKAAAKDSGIQFLELDWVDASEQLITRDSLEAAVRFLHTVLSRGESAVVHCAQGKSRSAVVTAAFLAAMQNCRIEEAMAQVQRQRDMAEPNEGFCEQLRALQRDKFFSSLHSSIEW